MNRIIPTLILSVAILFQSTAMAERVKDMAQVAGVRSNQLVGYGLIVGLDGTGDQTSQVSFTAQSLKSMLTQLGVVVPSGVNPQPKNVAAVALHASLPAFVKAGQTIDVTASSIGNSKSLRGGTLLAAPLKGLDGKVYAIAQGNLVVGGLSAGGADGSKITVNIPSVGRIPNGATVEREVASPFASGSNVTLNLHRADFTTADRLATAINRVVGPATAVARDAASVTVSAPFDSGQRVAFMSMLENIDVAPGESPARVIINSRTGTVVINRQVRVTPVAVSHGSLTVTISENTEVSQPGALSNGTTEVVAQSDVEVAEGSDRMFVFDPGVTLNTIVRAVNNVGAAPSDLVAILEALKEAGALRAQLLVI
ncbi:MAG TPA: flagellar basal body P-ring protein FlgI [Chromatiaceae bacterium]|jgi:flagellar P-ring protein precursor FlgI|nr:flagellar basal body P-ring protein FlgI [Chromatiaceae bacterium]HIA08603.1 flagellar basal body P-ring protein FlgI [Chromatiaceae bacterium]HIN82700.1 flagellar basal body P-ring protein FlgI [Chromatiales bacterium]HIO53760.1 flagellar basal body P-ring protein FlgI [Chromatiales bacterium]